MEKRNLRALGTDKEKLAADYLREKGYEILEMNYRIRKSEVDIVARDGKTMVFVEVKYRKTSACGTPGEAVDRRKQARISRAAMHYLVTCGLWERIPCRFDVIEILGTKIRHIVNAFDFAL